ncbi:hypothetical protein RRG08_052145 [Elysia crispata]|uniref:Uncharacterized protein n=1 Tax=Elysia crispata TaxID=231223 RepID=A0AAE0ZIH6_9GAST|nr:hypothetical protein RRG08_052145 [Elysia crispata]
MACIQPIFTSCKRSSKRQREQTPQPLRPPLAEKQDETLPANLLDPGCTKDGCNGKYKIRYDDSCHYCHGGKYPYIKRNGIWSWKRRPECLCLAYEEWCKILDFCGVCASITVLKRKEKV